LTHPGILATYAHGTYGSPVLRGVYVMDRFLCSPPNPPPQGVSTDPPVTIPGNPQTNRQLYEVATIGKGGLCASCHNVINPLGYSMEMFDTRGNMRTSDNGFAIDSSGRSLGFNFNSIFELSTSISINDRYRSCAAKKMISFSTGGWNIENDTVTKNEVIAASNNLLTRDLFRAMAMHPNYSQSFYSVR
jgi:hypothetical protein